LSVKEDANELLRIKDSDKMGSGFSSIIKQLRVIYCQRKSHIIIPFALSAPLFITIGLFIPKTYRSTTTILVEPQKIPKDYVKPTVTITVEDRLRTITQQIMSPSRLRKVLYKVGLVSDMSNRNLVKRLISTTQKNIKVDVGGKESFKITFTGKNPIMVMKITNQVTSLFIEENLKLSEQQAQSTTEFLSSELHNVARQLKEQEEKRQIFKQKYMGELPDQLEANLRTLDRLQMQLQTTRGLLKDSRNQAIILEQQMAMEEKKISNEKNIIAPEQQDSISGQLHDLKEQLSLALNRYSADWPAVKRLKSKIADLEAQLKDEPPAVEVKEKLDQRNPSSVLDIFKINLDSIRRRVADLEKEEKKLTREIEKYKRRVENIPKREGELIALGRDYIILKDTYTSLLDKKLDAKLSESLERKQKGENFIILDPAEVPTSPFFPKMYHILLGSLGGGICLSFLFVYTIKLLDNSFNDLEEVERSMGLPLIGIIPRIRTKAAQRKKFIREALATFLIFIYLGIIGGVILNRVYVRKKLTDWKILSPAQLI
jgi:polysaccharide chain length determinant protein (PEP-CTERM system associated)